MEEKDLSNKFSKEDAINFLSKNRIYPSISKKGKISLKGKNKTLLSKDIEEKLLNSLEIKTTKDCDNIKKIIRERAKEFNTHNIPIKNWIEEERPRELLVKNGADKLTPSKLLAIILRTGSIGKSAEELARNILNRYKSFRELDSATIEELCKIEGIGIAKAAQIKAALEIGKKLMQEEAKTIKKINSPREAALYVSEYFGPYLRDAKKEYFIVVLLDIKNKPIKNIEISKGSINESIVDSKEIIKEATLNSASSVILAHNHPSGETVPSEDDIKLTEQIVKACELVNVKVLDHIILGKNHDDFFSFANSKLIT